MLITLFSINMLFAAVIRLSVGQDITVTLYYDGACASPFGSFEIGADTCQFLPDPNIGYSLWASQIHPWYNNMVCEYYYDNYCGGDTTDTYRDYEGSLENPAFCINPGIYGLPSYGFQSFFCWYDDVETTNGARKRSIAKSKPRIKGYLSLEDLRANASAIPSTTFNYIKNSGKRVSNGTKTNMDKYLQEFNGTMIPARLTNSTKSSVKRQISNGDQYVGSTMNGAFGVVATAYNLGRLYSPNQTGFPGAAITLAGSGFTFVLELVAVIPGFNPE